MCHRVGIIHIALKPNELVNSLKFNVSKVNTMYIMLVCQTAALYFQCIIINLVVKISIARPNNTWRATHHTTPSNNKNMYIREQIL
jgi:hypothetical protein